MSNTANIEFRVGLTILLGLVMLVASLYWLQDYQLQSESRTIRVYFTDVGTLAVGDRVTVSGVRTGKVNDLRLVPGGVEVDLLMSGEVPLREDATFTIKNMGLMGERFVAVAPGNSSVLLDENKIVIGQYDTGLPEVLGLMGEMVVELRSLVGSFRQTIGSDTTLNKFNRTIDNFESISASMRAFLERNDSRFDRSADQLESATTRLNRLLVTNQSRIDSTTARMDRITYDLEVMVTQFDTVALHLRSFAERLDNPEGTAQLLLEDRRLYDDLRKTADNLDDLITDIRENPQKYINLRIELF